MNNLNMAAIMKTELPLSLLSSGKGKSSKSIAKHAFNNK